MKLTAILLATLLGLTAQSYAYPIPLKDAVVLQDLSSMRLLGQQYHMAGKAIADAWYREATAKHQGNLLDMTMATAQSAFNRFELNIIMAVLNTTKAKLVADIKVASSSGCLAPHAYN